MSVGVDVGATLAKVAILAEGDAARLELHPAGDTLAVARRIDALRPSRVGITGAGASRLAESLASGATRVGEFDAWVNGAARLLRKSEAGSEREPAPDRFLLVSLGTGTSVLLVDGASARRVGGTALGGGTVLGLGVALLGPISFDELCRLAARGSRRRVDLLVSDIYRAGEIPLPAELTAASFAKLASVSASDTAGAGADPSVRADLAAALMGLVGENVGLICSALAASSGVRRVVFGGSTLRDNAVLAGLLTAVIRASGHEATVLPDGEFTGAVGALALSGGERA